MTRAASASIRQRFQAALGFVLIAMAAIAALDVQVIAERGDALAQARQISRSRTQAEQLLDVLVTEESAAQAYLATGRAEYRADFEARYAQEQEMVARLRQSLQGRPREQAQLDDVSAAVTAWRAAARRDIETTGRGEDRLADVARGEEHKQLFDAMHRSLAAMQEATNASLAAARERFDAALNRVTYALYASLGVAALLLAGLVLLVRRWVLSPLNMITTAVRRVGAGELDTAIPQPGPPELAQLGGDVEDMRRRILSEADAALQANDALQVAEAELRLLVDSVRDYGIIRLDANGVIRSWNTGAAVMTGYPPEQAIGMSGQAFHPEDEPPEGHMDNILARAVTDGTATSQEWRRRADGSLYLVHSYVTCIRDEQGEVEGFAVIARDVTALVKAEEALAAANDQLAERAEELQRANGQLEAANRDLLAAYRELEAFSYSVSHDLRAPLRAVNAFSRLVLEDHRAVLGVQAADYLERVAANATRMGELIDDLLTFSRLLRSPLTKVRTSLADVARSAWDELTPLPEDHDVILELGELPTVPADPRLLKQVFVNLLGNAVKYSAARQPARISVECSVDPTTGQEPVITVRDNGIGFDERYADRLFGVFQRLHPAEEFEGTGIGLSIANRIVARHGGRIWAKASPGHGAAFSFTLGPDTVPVHVSSGSGTSVDADHHISRASSAS